MFQNTQVRQSASTHVEAPIDSSSVLANLKLPQLEANEVEVEKKELVGQSEPLSNNNNSIPNENLLVVGTLVAFVAVAKGLISFLKASEFYQKYWPTAAYLRLKNLFSKFIGTPAARFIDGGYAEYKDSEKRALEFGKLIFERSNKDRPYASIEGLYAQDSVKRKSHYVKLLIDTGQAFKVRLGAATALCELLTDKPQEDDETIQVIALIEHIEFDSSLAKLLVDCYRIDGDFEGSVLLRDNDKNPNVIPGFQYLLKSLMERCSEFNSFVEDSINAQSDRYKGREIMALKDPLSSLFEVEQEEPLEKSA